MGSAGSGMRGKMSVDDEPTGNVRLHVLCGDIGQIVLQSGGVESGAVDLVPADGVIFTGEGEGVGVGHVLFQSVFEGLDLDGDTVLQGAQFFQVFDGGAEFISGHTHGFDLLS